MALVDDPHPKKKTKIEEQMSTVESKIQQLKSDLNNLIATPP
jgi:protein-tyrosine-phosphatase